jgi:ubiquinone/menaquinone biosynthesis C-methylase UbiE
MFKSVLKLGFFLLYNHLAFSYDFVAWVVSWGHWSKWRQTVIQFLEPGPILELAYGTGGLLVSMTLSDLKPVGIDLSPFMARLTARRLRQHNLPLSIIRARAQALPFPSAYFTNVVATFPTNYIFEAESLAEIRRVLSDISDQTRLIVVMQGQPKGPAFINTAIEWLYQITGQRAVSKERILTVFTQAGFDVDWRSASFQEATALLIIAKKKA